MIVGEEREDLLSCTYSNLSKNLHTHKNEKYKTTSVRFTYQISTTQGFLLKGSKSDEKIILHNFI